MYFTISRNYYFIECECMINVSSANHPDNVVKAMETIMTSVLEESDEISYDLALCLLSSVKKDTKVGELYLTNILTVFSVVFSDWACFFQDFSPTASSLGERIIRNCCAKFKPRIMEVIHSTCSCWRDYRKFVASMFHDNLKLKNNKSSECMVCSCILYLLFL